MCLKPRLRVDENRVSDESTHESLSSGETEVHLLRMRCQDFGEELLERDAVEASNFDGQNRA